jgi:hypothetical protein
VDHASPANAFNVPLDGVSWNGNMYVFSAPIAAKREYTP